MICTQSSIFKFLLFRLVRYPWIAFSVFLRCFRRVCDDDVCPSHQSLPLSTTRTRHTRADKTIFSWVMDEELIRASIKFDFSRQSFGIINSLSDEIRRSP